MASEGRLSNVRLVARELFTFFPTIWLFLAPLLLSPIAIFGGSAGRCGFVILLMSCYWVVEVVPLAAISLLPVVLLPLLSVYSVHKVAEAYLNDTNMMMISSMLIALAVEESGLHKRVALRLLTAVGTRPHKLMAGFMIITSFMSMWLSDTATAALMCPIAIALLDSIMRHKTKPSLNPEASQSMEKADPNDKSAPLDWNQLSPRDRGICKCMTLIVAHASLIGGTGTINATGPNLIFRAALQDLYPGADTGVSYLTWMLFALPPMIFYMLSSWTIVQLRFLGFTHFAHIFKKPTEEERKEEEILEKTIKTSYRELGPISWSEKWTLFWFVLLVVLWITSDPKVFTGWVDLFPGKMVTDSCAGILIGFILFAFPNKKPDLVWLRRDKKRRSIVQQGIITWDTMRRRFAWSVVLLLGAGIAISKSVQVSGLSGVIVCWLNTLSSLPAIFIQVLLAILVVTCTEFSTNTATASVFVPIAFSIAEKLGVHPLYFSIPATIGPSFAFMFPMATPPNAIVYETKTMTMFDMVTCGILLNLACITITIINMNTYTYRFFDMGTYPEYAHISNITHLC